MQISSDKLIDGISIAFDNATKMWCRMPYVRIITFTLFIYFAGYFQLGIATASFIAFVLIQSHTNETQINKSRLKAKYMNFNKNPNLLKELIPDIPKWVKYNDWERCTFLNNAIEIIWPFLSGATERSIQEILIPLLHEQLPIFLTKMDITAIDFGDIPLKINATKVMSDNRSKDDDTEINEISWDLDIELSGGDAEIAILAGNKVVSVSAVIRDIEIKGTVRIVFSRLFEEWPLFNEVRVAFVEKPDLSYNIRAGAIPLSKIPGFVPWLNGMIEEGLQEYFIWPNEFIVDMEMYMYTTDNTLIQEAQNISRLNMDQTEPKGVLRVRIIEAKNLRNKDIFGKSDPIAKVWLDHAPKVIKYCTRKITSTLNPTWDEIFEFTVYDKSRQRIQINIENSNFSRKNDVLGDLCIDIKDLEDKTYVEKCYTLTNVNQGLLRVELYFSPFVQRPNECTVNRSSSMPEMSSKKEEMMSQPFEDIIEEGGETPSRTAFEEQDVASDMYEESQDSYQGDIRKLQKVTSVPPFINNKERSICMAMGPSPDKKILKITKLKKSMIPIFSLPNKPKSPTERTFDGILNINLISGTNLKGYARNGNSDPFVVFRVGERKQKSTVKKKTVNPIWNEAFQFKVKEEEIRSGFLNIKVKDHDNWSKDKHIGSLELNINDIMTRNDEGVQSYTLKGIQTAAALCSLQMEIAVLSILALLDHEDSCSKNDATSSKTTDE